MCQCGLRRNSPFLRRSSRGAAEDDPRPSKPYFSYWQVWMLLTGRSGRSSHLCPSRQTPSPRNSWRTSHTGPGIASPTGSSTRSCPTNGRFQHLRVTVSLNPLGFRPEELAAAPRRLKTGKSPWLDSIFAEDGVYTQCWVSSQILFLWLPQFSSCLRQLKNSKDLEKSTNSCDPSARKTIGGPKQLLTHISAVCPL